MLMKTADCSVLVTCESLHQLYDADSVDNAWHANHWQQLQCNLRKPQFLNLKTIANELSITLYVTLHMLYIMNYSMCVYYTADSGTVIAKTQCERLLKITKRFMYSTDRFHVDRFWLDTSKHPVVWFPPSTSTILIFVLLSLFSFFISQNFLGFFGGRDNLQGSLYWLWRRPWAIDNVLPLFVCLSSCLKEFTFVYTYCSIKATSGFAIIYW